MSPAQDFFVSLTPIHRLEPEGCGSCLKNRLSTSPCPSLG
ncbi:hypothetical protein LEMLEM_LOCUS16061 [Lemmus lemmus]